MQRTSPRETRRQHEQGLVESSFKWTRLGAVFGGVAILVAIAIGVATIADNSKSDKSHPIGIVVNAVPNEPIRGAAIYPVPGGQPSDYLPGGVTLYVSCLQSIKPDYLFARISDGPYKYHWVDVFDIKTPGGAGINFLKSKLQICGPEKALPSAKPKAG